MGVPGIGRRQKPEALRRLQGSGVRPHQHRQPRPKLGRPGKPAYLSACASAYWDEGAALLEGEHRLSESDGPWLCNYAEACADYQKWRAASDIAPLTQVKVSVDGAGVEHQEVRVHPVHQQVRLARKALTELLKEAGLTPASRARVSVPSEDTQDDPTETFLRAVK
jgi:P27 family predicted phage terminase small subunit